MSLRSVRIPKYRHHKGSGQAFVQFKGERFYLGKHGTEKSQERYRRFISENVTSTRPTTIAPASPVDGLTVVELVAAYWQFAQGYYMKDGQPTGWQVHIRLVLRLLKESYGSVPVTEFGPLALKALRQRMIDGGHSRKYINKLIAIIPRMFKWGCAEELVPVTVHQALATVAGLRKGRSPAPDHAPVAPVPEADIQATLSHLPEIPADMLLIQRLTDSRPGEVLYSPSVRHRPHRGRVGLQAG